MYRLVKVFSIVFIYLLIFTTTCIAAGKLAVFVSILPQQYFVQQIGRDLVADPGHGPARCQTRYI
jgi:ABC-type Zn uptake system ZnuABC Zn-binding protein ZnuA